MTITPEEIARLRALEAKATPGPWVYASCGGDPYIEGPVSDGHDYATNTVAESGYTDNCFLIVAARNALPRLLDEIERLRAASADYCESCGWLMKFPDGCANCESVRLRADLREAVALLDGWASPSGHVEEWNRRVDALLAKHKEDA